VRKPDDPEAKRSAVQAKGACVCGAVRFEIDVPAVWAWHDHSAASRHAQGAAYATYIGSWKSRFRMLAGEDDISRYEKEGRTRSFCACCGTPLFYERARSPKMINIPRSLFETRTGREPRYHMNLREAADWEYAGAPLVPLKGYPGVMYERPKKKAPRRVVDAMFEDEG
jgi:hypothetical protein